MTPTNLPGLIERLRAATEGSRELDRAISLALKLGWDYSADWPTGADGITVPYAHPYTTDLSAIVALVEKKLPKWNWQVRKTGYAEINHPTMHLKDAVGKGKTPALGLCICLLALQSEVSNV